MEVASFHKKSSYSPNVQEGQCLAPRPILRSKTEHKLLLQSLHILPTFRRANASLLDLSFEQNEHELLLQGLHVLPTVRRASLL
ncbi:hypothetical protein JTB14_031502 [Gonioctena quinquepunctata]|nr:hypothetical protein JTB14_031502 [Gonioctena quinquepunctata]